MKDIERQNQLNRADLRSSEVFIKFYDYYAPKLFRHAFYRLSSKEAAQDAVSQVFMKTWEYLKEKNKSIKNPKAFIYQLANNLIIDSYRSKSRKTISIDQTFGDFNQEKQEISDDWQNFNKILKYADFQLIINKLQQLKPEYRDILIWRYIDDLGIADIAKLAKKSQANVAVMIFRALQALKTIINAT